MQILLYISRAKSSRKIINEDYLIGKLNTVTKVQCLTLEDYTFTEKISIFKAAKIIIGSYGAGLVFSMFTEENSQLIDILGPNF
jgi:capsular polysaccharide biosynthesis protein